MVLNAKSGCKVRRRRSEAKKKDGHDGAFVLVLVVGWLGWWVVGGVKSSSYSPHKYEIAPL